MDHTLQSFHSPVHTELDHSSPTPEYPNSTHATPKTSPHVSETPSDHAPLPEHLTSPRVSEIPAPKPTQFDLDKAEDIANLHDQLRHLDPRRDADKIADVKEQLAELEGHSQTSSASFHSAVESDHSPIQTVHLSIEPEQQSSTHSAHSIKTSPHVSEEEQQEELPSSTLPAPTPKHEPTYADFVTREESEPEQETLGPPTRIYDGNTGE